MNVWKKIRNLFLASAVMLASAGVLRAQTVEAHAYGSYDELYPLSCSAYSVAKLEKNGSFTETACTSDYSAAKQQMYALGDAGVIRHHASGSASKIIDMSSGVVYSYPQRNGNNTAYIEQFADNVKNEKNTYVTVHREMRFEGTYQYYGNGDGQVRVQLNGFDGYIHLSDVDLVPMAAIANDIPLYLGGNDATPTEEYPFLTHVHQAYYQAVQNGAYRDLVYHCYSGWGGSSTYPSEWTFAIGPAADWMKTGSTYYSSDGTTFYTDRYYSNLAGVYYDYYQFLPLRTRSAVSADVLNHYLNDKANGQKSAMKDKGQVFVDAGNSYGINSLLLFSIGCLESGYGRSNFALERNNLFGINAYDSDPDQATRFSSVDQCIREEAGIFLRGFIDINDWRFFGSHLGNKGSGVNVKYAADPYWGMKMAAIAYDVDKYANNYNGQLSDYGKVQLANVTDDRNITIRKSMDGDALYQTAYGATYQKNHILAVLSGVGDCYSVQSTSYLSSGSVASVKGMGLIDYDWSHSIGYVKKSDVTLINTADISDVGTTPTADPVNSLSTVAWSEGKLKLSGDTYRPGIFVNDANTAALSITVVDDLLSEAAKAEVQTERSGNDDVRWTALIDPSALENGTYLISTSLSYSALSQYNIDGYLSAGSTKLPQAQDLNGKTYSVTADQNTGLLLLTVSDAKKEEEEPVEENLTMQKGVLSASYEADQDQLIITGLAFFEGKDAPSKDESISAAVSLVDMNTKEKVKDLNTTMEDMPGVIDLFDGKDYTRIGWTASLNPSELAEGDYYLQITLNNGKTSDTRQLVSSSRKLVMPVIQTEDHAVRFFANSMASFRLELNVSHSAIDYSVVNKPQMRHSFYANESLKLDGSVLKIDGLAFLYSVDTGAANNPGYSLFLEGEDGKQYPFDSSGARACSLDYEEMLAYDHDLSNACLSATMDMKDLPSGTYRIYIDATASMNTDNGLEEYRDIYDVYGVNSRSDAETDADGRTYSIARSGLRNTYLITIREN